ncbi:MAG: hypothetical protein LBL91_00710 [Lachnospiraceae bacterium]|jgi:hypothetical protein|nr:hypothetical protein [Lachnospiraceae bacterium]
MNDGNIKIGMSGSSTITLQEANNVPVIPVQAVQIKDDAKYVQVIKEDGSTENVNIEAEIADSDYVQITSELEVGTKIQYVDSSTGNKGTTSTVSSNIRQSGMLSMLSN